MNRLMLTALLVGTLALAACVSDADVVATQVALSIAQTQVAAAQTQIGSAPTLAPTEMPIVAPANEPTLTLTAVATQAAEAPIEPTPTQSPDAPEEFLRRIEGHFGNADDGRFVPSFDDPIVAMLVPLTSGGSSWNYTLANNAPVLAIFLEIIMADENDHCTVWFHAGGAGNYSAFTLFREANLVSAVADHFTPNYNNILTRQNLDVSADLVFTTILVITTEEITAYVNGRELPTFPALEAIPGNLVGLGTWSPDVEAENISSCEYRDILMWLPNTP